MIRDENGQVLTDTEAIVEGWRAYFETLLSEENHSQRRTQITDSTYEEATPFSKEEIRSILEGMQGSKAVSLDNIPVEVWWNLGDRARVDFLTTVDPRYLELGYLEQLIISNRFSIHLVFLLAKV